jgi:hypothetical protein
MANFENGKIYKVVNTIDDKIYVGSTVRQLSQRMGHHGYNALQEGKQSKLYIHMRNVGLEHFKILLIKSVSCDTKQELEREEFDAMKSFDQTNLLNENIVYNKRSKEHIKKVADQQRGEKSVLFKYGSVFNRKGKNLEGHIIDSWVFNYMNIQDNKRRSFQFSIKKYGNDEAFKMAQQKQKEIYPNMIDI